MRANEPVDLAQELCHSGCSVLHYPAKNQLATFLRMIPLIRTEGKPFVSGPTLSAERFLDLPDLQRASKTALTLQAEAALDLGDCLYFFAGHACPDFGEVVLVYEGDIADAGAGSATPFDTGGFHLGKVRYRATPGESEKEYCKRHSRPLVEWRSEAQAYIDEYFESSAQYVLGAGPQKDDPSGRLGIPGNERRAWTWEVRIHRDHPIELGLRRVWMSAEYYEAVRQGRIDGRASARCKLLLGSGKVKAARPEDGPHEIAEREASTWV